MRHDRFVPDLRGMWTYLSDGKADWKPKALSILAVVYLLWPLDLVPDLAPLIGWLDDIGFVSLATWYLFHATNAYLLSKENQSKRLPPPDPPQTS